MTEIKVSYIEVQQNIKFQIYNEQIIDLLDSTNQNLEIREHLTKGVHIPNLSEIVVKDENVAMKLL